MSDSQTALLPFQKREERIAQCKNCGGRFPLTEDFFRRRPESRGGTFRSTCRECEEEIKRERQAEEDAKSNRQIGRAVTGLLNRIKDSKAPIDALTNHIEDVADEIHTRLKRRRGDTRVGATPSETVSRVIGRVILDTVEDEDESNFAKLKATAQYHDLLALSVRRSPEAPLDFTDSTEEELRDALYPAAMAMLEQDEDFLMQCVLSRGPDFLKRLLKQSGIDVLDEPATLVVDGNEAAIPDFETTEAEIESALDGVLVGVGV